jgi:tetratricopeptide (TPR) repeat protein
MNRRPDDCPDLEMIASYLDGRVTEHERTHVARHMAACQTCYFVFTEAAQMRRTEATVARKPEPPSPVPSPTSPVAAVAWKTASAAVGIAACALLAIQVGIVPWRTSESSELRALVAAVGTERPIAARLTGGFAYGPLRGVTRSGDSANRTISPDIRIAGAQIEKQAIERRTSQTLSALGTAYLVQGDIPRAITALEQAADQPNPDARILNDLAAAYLARGTRDNDAADFAKALTLAARVIAANPRLVEGWFNRAYALERLGSPNEARRAWEDYLKVDEDSDWAAEARRHIGLDAERVPDQQN